MRKVTAIALGLGFFLLFSALSGSPVMARLGVGVATGKIEIKQALYPGTIYQLPPLTVLNTGDETATYGVDVAYHEKQPELRPLQAWFTFTPSEFVLEPGKSQMVKITLNVPIRVKPGKYFAYLEGFPKTAAKGNGATIGIAAAAKLYFEVAPANIFVGLYYRVFSFWQSRLPWSNIVAGTIVLGAAVAFLKKNFNFQVSKKSSHKKKEEKSEKDE